MKNCIKTMKRLKIQTVTLGWHFMIPHLMFSFLSDNIVLRLGTYLKKNGKKKKGNKNKNEIK